MTRFARARGSKSSNKREAEDATPWKQMKESLLTKPDSANSKQQEIVNYKETLESLKPEATVSWSTFDEETGETNKNSKKLGKKKINGEQVNLDIINGINKKKKKKKKLKSTENDQLGSTNEELKSNKKRKLKSVENHGEETTHELKCNKKMKLEKNPLLNTDQEIVIKKENLDESTAHSQQNETSESHAQETKKRKKNKKQNKTNLEGEISTTPDSKKDLNSQKKIKKEFKNRRKPEPQPYQMDINGEMVDIVTYDGFPIMKADATRLDELKKSLFAKGIPHGEIKKIMKLQRRSAEKALSRAKKRVCFNCRRSGHNLSECPVLNNGEGTGICFKCGSTEHTHFECKVVKKQDFKFAQCFICKEQGHISNQCPDNPRGLYPKGGACKLCGDVTHLKRFCPTLPKDSEPTIDNFLDDDIGGNTHQVKRPTTNATQKKKHIVF